MRRPILAILTATAALSVGLAACGSSGDSGGTSTAARTTGQNSSAPAPGPSGTTTGGSSSPAASALFGPGCASLGLTDAAISQATQAPVATVAANIPFLSSVVAAANAAGLTASFDSAPALTVFAPVDDAFKKEPPQQVQSLLTDPAMKPQLIATLQYHVLPGEVEKAQLDGAHKTLQGTDITVTGSGDSYTVNGTAKIICGGIHTKNAVVYLIDTVLHPAA